MIATLEAYRALFVIAWHMSEAKHFADRVIAVNVDVMLAALLFMKRMSEKLMEFGSPTRLGQNHVSIELMPPWARRTCAQGGRVLALAHA